MPTVTNANSSKSHPNSSTQISSKISSKLKWNAKRDGDQLPQTAWHADVFYSDQEQKGVFSRNGNNDDWLRRKRKLQPMKRDDWAERGSLCRGHRMIRGRGREWIYFRHRWVGWRRLWRILRGILLCLDVVMRIIGDVSVSWVGD